MSASISSWCGTNDCPPNERCDVCALLAEKERLKEETLDGIERRLRMRLTDDWCYAFKRTDEEYRARRVLYALSNLRAALAGDAADTEEREDG